MEVKALRTHTLNDVWYIKYCFQAINIITNLTLQRLLMDCVLFVCPVKLNPPFNLSVKSSGKESEVCVQWSNGWSKEGCINDTVGYQKASGPLMVSNLASCRDVRSVAVMLL